MSVLTRVTTVLEKQ